MVLCRYSVVMQSTPTMGAKKVAVLKPEPSNRRRSLRVATWANVWWVTVFDPASRKASKMKSAVSGNASKSTTHMPGMDFSLAISDRRARFMRALLAHRSRVPR